MRFLHHKDLVTLTLSNDSGTTTYLYTVRVKLIPKIAIVLLSDCDISVGQERRIPIFQTSKGDKNWFKKSGSARNPE